MRRPARQPTRPEQPGAAARNAAALLASFSISLSALGCLGTSTPASFYTIPPNAVADAPRDGRISTSDVALQVGPLSLPRFLDRPQIVTRPAENPEQLHVSELHRWAGSLATETQRVLADDLASRLGTHRVVLHPATPPFALDYRVAVDINRMDGELNGTLTLDARWIVMRGERGEALAVDRSRFTENVAPGSYDGLVTAHGRALSRLGEAIATRIVALRGGPE